MLKHRKGEVGHHGPVRVTTDEFDELLRTPHRQRPEQHDICNAEHGGVGANAQREGNYRHCCYPEVLAEHARAVTDILNHALNEIHAPSVAALFLDLLDTAESAQGDVAGFPGAHSRRDVLLDLLLEMECHLVGKLLVQLLSSEQRAQTA